MGINFGAVSDRPNLASSDDGLEELGDEVIIAQETGAHAPQRRAQVTTDHPTVVISEPPAQEERRMRATVKISRRERSEKTVVIRDRKQVEQMRRAISDRASAVRRASKPPVVEKRTLYLLGAAALASLALGTLIAFLVDATADARTPAPAPALVQDEPGTAPASDTSSSRPPIDLDALPDPPAKARRADAPGP